MKRLLIRPPRLDLRTSFSEAYRDNRFRQLELVSMSELMTEAGKHGISLTDRLLEELDRYGVFKPVAFAGKDWQGGFFEPRWNLDALTFRDEVGYQRWSRYAFREERSRRILPLYSPWQLMYLKSAIEDRQVVFTLPFLLGRRERLMTAIKNHRPFWRVDRDFWLGLEDRWRPVVLLLCWLQNRYYPLVAGRTRLIYRPDKREPVDPMPDEVKSFNAEEFIERVGVTIEGVRSVYEQLSHAGKVRDPIESLYMVFRAASPRARERFEGDARLAHLIYDGAEVFRRLLRDLTGEVPPDCDEVGGWPQDWKERFLGHERRLYYDRDDFKRILERRRLSPFGVHVFVEGPSDKELLGGLMDALWGDHRSLGVRFTVLRGIGEVARQEALFEAFSTYARKGLLVADDEGKIARDLARLRRSGLLIEDDCFHGWKRNIEEDNATSAELVRIAKSIAVTKGAALKLSVAKLNRLRKAHPRRGLARIIVDNAREQGASVTKDEIAIALRELILRELSEARDEKTVSERRPVLGLALAIGRFSI